MGNGVQMIPLLFSFLCFILILLTCIMPFWRRNGIEYDGRAQELRTSGLWLECTVLPAGNSNCVPYYDRFFLGVPGVLQVIL